MSMKLFITTALSLTLPLSALANAGQTESDAAPRLDTVSVKSDKKTDDGLAAPQSESTLTLEEIDNKQAGTVAGIIRDLPGVDIYGGPNLQGARFSIRGERRQDRQIIQVDGVNQYFEQYRMGSFFGDPELLKSISVVRGPAGGQFGSGAVAGAISMTTKDASDFLQGDQTIGAKVKVGFNTNGNEKTGAAYLYGKLQDNIELLGAFSLRDSDDFEFPNGTTFVGSQVNVKNILLKASAEVAPFQKITGTFQYMKSSGIAEFRQADRGTYGDYGYNEGLLQRDMSTTQLTLDYTFNDPDNDLIDLKVLFGYVKTENIETGLAPSDSYATVGSLSEGEQRFADFKSYQFTVNNKSVLGGDDVKQTLTYGVQFNSRKRSSLAEANVINPDFDIVTDPNSYTGEQVLSQLYYQPDGTRKVFTAFIQDEIVIYDKLTLTPAITYSSYKLSGNADGWSDHNPPAEWFADYSVSGWSPSISADFEVVPAFHLIAGYYTGLRGPTVDNVYSIYAADTRMSGGELSPRYRNSSLQLLAESAKSFEFGARVEANGLFTDQDSLRARMVYFQNKIDDRITGVRTYVASNTIDNPYHINSGLDRYKGWELEATYYNGPAYVRLAYSTVVKDLIIDGVETPGTDSPADQFVISAGSKIQSLDLDIGIRAEIVSEISDILRTGTGETYPGFTALDVYMTWTPESMKGFALKLAVANLANNEYQQFKAGSPAWGRDFRITASYQF